MDESNTSIDNAIAAELSAAVEQVSKESAGIPEAPKAEVVDAGNAPNKPVAEKTDDKGDEGKEVFAADDALIERAVKAGLLIEDAKSFKSAEQADRILSKLEAASATPPKNEEANGKQKSEDAGFPVEDFEDAIKTMEEDGDYDPEILKMFKGMSAVLKQQSETIASLKKAGATAEATSFFDQQVNSLGEGVAKHLDAASRSKLESKFRMLERAYEGDKSMTREGIFKEAATLAIGDLLAKADAESKAAKLNERRNLALARPGGERGNNGKMEQLSTEEAVAATIFDALTK